MYFAQLIFLSRPRLTCKCIKWIRIVEVNFRIDFLSTLSIGFLDFRISRKANTTGLNATGGFVLVSETPSISKSDPSDRKVIVNKAKLMSPYFPKLCNHIPISSMVFESVFSSSWKFKFEECCWLNSVICSKNCVLFCTAKLSVSTNRSLKPHVFRPCIQTMISSSNPSKKLIDFKTFSTILLIFGSSWLA